MKTSFPIFCLFISTAILFSCTSDQQTISDSPIAVTLDTISEKMETVNTFPISQTKIKNKTSRLSKATLYKQLQTPTQTFLISSTKDTSLKGSEGTKLNILKNSFLLNGQPYSGSVSLHLKECYSYEDMILHNLSTLSNDRLLESGGMICLEAFTNDHQKLTLDSKQPIGLQMPSEEPKQYMQLFYADKNMNWLQASDSKPQFAALSNTKKTRASDIRSGNYFITDNGFGTVITTITILKDGKEKLISSTSYANRSLYQPGLDSMTLYFEMDEYGCLYNTVIRDTSFTKNLKITSHRLESMNDVSMTYYPYTPGNKKVTDCNLLLIGEANEKGFPSSLSFLVSRSSHLQLKKYAKGGNRSKVIVRNTYIFRSRGGNGRQDRIKEVQAKLDSSNGSVQDISAADLQYYAFSINQLGWINCDRFYNVPASQKTNFVVTNEAGTDLKLVFSDMKSVLNGYQLDGKTMFSNVPKDKAVTLIGIRIVNQKAELAMLKTTTQEICQEPLVYTPVSVEELKERIKAML